mmetsp:Transcript_12964/g.30572  ORF Transcript_12964/g.30572 Transcript_12964/m.30572 type:complete len:421 (-) Transcript_12964:315-1577(-)
MMRSDRFLEEEKKDEETVSFLATDTEKRNTGKPGIGNGFSTRSTVHNNGLLGYWYGRHKTRFLAALALSVIGYAFLSKDESAAAFAAPPASSSAKDTVAIRKDEDGIIRFSCPSQEYAVNAEGEDFEEYYTSVSREITDNRTEFLSTFRTAEFDGWGKSYNKIKSKSTDFKAKYYPRYLKEGSHLYESACGIGLNLYMTLEILGDEKLTGGEPITGITVYGNEYVKESVDKAREVVLAEGVIPSGNRQGTICPGDSTNLDNVPSGAFDLVYTGYLTPDMDTLNLHQDDPCFDDYTEYDDICAGYHRYQKNNGKADRLRKDNNDWMANYLWDTIVQRQRDWYGRWVSEMARIAKPGVPVIVEQVSIPYCLNQYDWGGVVKEWWHETAEKNTYGWNVDPDSIEMMDDTIHEHRYHVFMLKNK